MKKLMFAALAVAACNAFAMKDFQPQAVEKIQLTLKQVSSNKVESVKYKGFIFWTEGMKDEIAVLWNTKDTIPTNGTETAFGKKVSFKKVYKTVNLGEYTSSLFTVSSNKKQGKGISFGKDYIGYGSGTCTLEGDFLQAEISKIKESISGNMVNQAEREYGTWKLSFDKSTTKACRGVSQAFNVSDVLKKNKVEFWDFN